IIAEDTSTLKELRTVFVEVNAKLIPFEVISFTLNQKKAIIKFDDVHSEEDTAVLLQKKIFLPLDLLPRLKGDQFYYHEIKGYTIIDENMGTLGTIEEIYEMPGQDLIAMLYKGQEVLIPIDNHFVKTPDHVQRILNVNLPDGLLELYSGNEEESDEDKTDNVKISDDEN